MPRATHDALSKAVDNERRRATVRSLDMSFNELADMYRTGELRIDPEYQRTFRWSQEKQSRFIESVILEMPVPPIYAVEIREGEWELIDGLQRLSTFLHLRSELNLPDRQPPIIAGKSRLKLRGCDIVTELDGYTFENLTTSIQYRIRRATLRLELVRQEGNPRFAYYMFKRLNTGGEPLSNQEARNCSIRLLGGDFNSFLFELSGNAKFEECVSDVTDEFRDRMGLPELVLRYFAFKNALDEYIHDIDPFLTDFMERVTDRTAEDAIPFDFANEKRIFEKTFHVLSLTLKERTGRRWTGKSYGGGFSMSHYESFSIGVSKVLDCIPDNLTETDPLVPALTGAMEEVKKEPAFREMTTGGGKNFRRIYAKKIGFVEERLRKVL